MEISKTAKDVIALAEAIQSYWDIELPKRHPDYPLIRNREDSGPPPPEKKELEQLFANLPDDVIYQLIVIMYIGRGDYGSSHYGPDVMAAMRENMKATFKDPARAAAQMMAKGSLAEYLSDGLEELKKNGIDVDHLTSTTLGASH